MSDIKKSISSIFIFSILLANSTFLKAQIVLDSLRYNELVTDPQFVFVKGGEPQPSIFSRAWNYIWSLINRILSFTLSGNSSILSIFILTGVVAVIGYLVYQNYYKKTKPDKASLSDDFYKYYNIEKEGLQDRINNAVQNEDYRTAIRYTFILTLKLLGENQKISWSEYKSNKFYHSQIKNESYADKFKNLLNSYEYFWYGEHPADATQYQAAEQDLNQVKEALENV